ncbi:30S ribosomal protein S6--L-glutamate ligase [Candidatus Peregrinibacteria bacterium CG_4_9_14_0_2_um_filter_53_11]|nr:MAG: 30S ribosomal protein S6--L-glutamate ligase [Candidatus Peregrinibacteria bacterium CG_4_9_14_0_2_um_filter_53_11]
MTAEFSLHFGAGFVECARAFTAHDSMKIGILLFGTKTKVSKESLYSSQLVKKAILARGHAARIYYSNDFQYTFYNSRPGLLYRSKRFIPPDVLIVSANILSNIDLHLALVKQMELMGVRLYNSSVAIARAKNKLRTIQVMAHANIAVPKTLVVTDMNYLDAAIKELGSFPMIIKLAQGSFGSGVSIIESPRSLRSILDLVGPPSENQRNHVLIQEYVREAKGKDLRVFVVDGKVIAAMQRKARRGEFRANVAIGGSATAIEITPEETIMAIESSRILGLSVAGVDLIRTATGPKILEVNANPGLRGITGATKLDIAGHIVEYAERLFDMTKQI